MKGVPRLLGLQPDIEVVAACADMDALLEAVDRAAIRTVADGGSMIDPTIVNGLVSEHAGRACGSMS